MVRIKRGIVKHKKRERLLKQTKGFGWRRKSTTKAAKEAMLHAMRHAFRGRKEKKRVFRAQWQTAINTASRASGDLSYSKLIAALKKTQILLDRKILAELAKTEPETFTALIQQLDAARHLEK